MTACSQGMCSTNELRRNSDLTTAKSKRIFPENAGVSFTSETEAAGVEPAHSEVTHALLPGKLVNPWRFARPSSA